MADGGGGVHDNREGWLGNYIALVVTTVWATTIMVGIFNSKYDPPVAIYPVLLAVVGWVFGFRIAKTPPEPPKPPELPNDEK